jgi:hypothetical protein
MRTIALTLLIALLPAASAEAGSWLFERSYYSHHPVTSVEVQRRSVGGPYYSRQQGEYVRSGFRNIRTTIIANGRVYEQGQFFESWVQGGTQF